MWELRVEIETESRFARLEEEASSSGRYGRYEEGGLDGVSFTGRRMGEGSVSCSSLSSGVSCFGVVMPLVDLDVLVGVRSSGSFGDGAAAGVEGRAV
jgi:hypothetical protein